MGDEIRGRRTQHDATTGEGGRLMALRTCVGLGEAQCECCHIIRTQRREYEQLQAEAEAWRTAAQGTGAHLVRLQALIDAVRFKRSNTPEWWAAINALLAATTTKEDAVSIVADVWSRLPIEARMEIERMARSEEDAHNQRAAAEIERLRTENDRWRDAAWHARRNEDVLQALIDAYAAMEPNSEEALLAAATKGDDRG